MKNLLIVAAVVAFSAAAATTGVFAQTYRLSADEQQICSLLEIAHESSCAEYEAMQAKQYAAAAAPSDETAESIVASK